MHDSYHLEVVLLVLWDFSKWQNGFVQLSDVLKSVSRIRSFELYAELHVISCIKLSVIVYSLQLPNLSSILRFPAE